MRALVENSPEGGCRTSRLGTPEVFGQVSERVAWLVQRQEDCQDPTPRMLRTWGWTLNGEGFVASKRPVELRFPYGQRERVSLLRADVRVDGANSGIIAIDRGAVMADENTGKMALSGPGTLTAGTVCAGWDAGDFPLAHAILNRLIICRAMIIASRGLSGQIETYDEDGRRENPALANLRRRTLGLYRSYGTETFGDFYDSRYLFPQHRLAVEADGYALRADLQARVLRDADGREVTLGHTPREIGPFEAAIGTWGSPQFYHRESGQLVRVGFTKDQYRGRVLVMEHRQ